MDANRKTAYLALLDVEKKKAYSNLALNHQIALNKPGNEAFVRSLVYGVLEHKLHLNYIIDQMSKNGIARMKMPDQIILRMGIHQLSRMDSVPEYAAVSESVRLAKKYARGRDGFINAMLRAYVDRKHTIKLPDRSEDEIGYLSTKYSYAPWIVGLWMDTYEGPFAEELMDSGNQVPDTEVRLNWLRIMKPDLMERLRNKGFSVEEGSLSPNALHIRGSGLLKSEMYKDGLFSVQDEASQVAVDMLAPEKGDTVMDVCAAPGGKSLAMAERMNNEGTIIASDIYRRKVEIIDREAKRLGITNIRTRTWDATRVDSTMAGKADKVLVDAPCSGLGVVRRKPEIKYKEYTEDLAMLPRKQAAILSASAEYVRPGGVLMYCTCTINPAENERSVSDFLRSHGAFEMDETRQLLPNVDGTDGFFICRMTKRNHRMEN